MWLDCILFPQIRTMVSKRPPGFKSSSSRFIEHLEDAGFQVEEFEVGFNVAAFMEKDLEHYGIFVQF